MKRIFLILLHMTLCLCIRYEADAQDAVYLIPNPQTARWSYIETDNKGKQTATIYNSVESIEGDGVDGKIKVLVEEIPVASPKDISTSFNFYRFKDGEFMVDMISGIEDNLFEGKSLDSLIHSTIKDKYPDLPEDTKKEVIEKTKSQYLNISGDTRGIPRYPKVGKLPDYEFHFKMSIMSMRVSSTERRIVGTETIQTPAGSFDCFILEETITTKITIVKDVERVKSWYAYGIGLVKEITYDKNGNLISTMILNGINW